MAGFFLPAFPAGGLTDPDGCRDTVCSSPPVFFTSPIWSLPLQAACKMQWMEPLHTGICGTPFGLGFLQLMRNLFIPWQSYAL
jgi:hypothetical protein